MSFSPEQSGSDAADSGRGRDETWHRWFLEVSLSGVFEKDAAGRVIEANEVFLSMLGYARGDLPLMWTSLLPDELADVLQASESSASPDGEPSVLATALLHRNGRRVPVLARVAKDPQRGTTLGFVIDQTEQHAAIRRLEQERQEFETIFDHVPAYVIYKDTRNRMLRVNQRVADDLGTTKEAVRGQHARTYYPDHADDYYQDDLEVIHSGKPKLGIIEPVDKQGGKGWINTDKIPVRNDAGDVERILLVCTDISDLKEATETAEARNRELQTLVHVMSHDLREQVRAMRMFAGMIQESHAAQLDDTGQDYLRRVLRGGDRLNQLLDDILSLSRVQRGENQNVTVDLNAVVEAVCHDLRQRIEETKAVVDIGNDLPSVWATPRWVHQAVLNLISNALKFTRGDEPPRVSVCRYTPMADEPDLPGLVVTDQGPGVQADQVDKLFDLFVRAVSRDVPGTGAGLAIVRQVAERHGGRVWVRSSDPNHPGASFVLTFGRAVQPGQTTSNGHLRKTKA